MTNQPPTPHTKPTTLFKVVQGYEFSTAHQSWYAGGSQDYLSDGTVQQYYSMYSTCICGESLKDGEPICAPRYDAQYWEVVHVNCCDQHDHSKDDD